MPDSLVAAATACWACATPDPAPSTRLAPLPFFRCETCGFEQRDAPTAAPATEHYLGDDYARDRAVDFTEQLEARRHDARVRVRWIKRFQPAGRLLDVGTAGGAFVLEAGAAGYDASGIEPAPTFAEAARELGLDVANATLESADLAPGAYDVITLWHVLEHIEDPIGALAHVRAALKPGGVFALEVPNAGSGIGKAMGTAWPMLEPEVHVGQYTAAALRRLLRRAGFDPHTIETPTSLPYSLPRDRFTVGAVVHRIKWRTSEGELLRAVASPA